jgi:alpha-beta hydrolase superfamily lysophospholipase
VLLIAAGTTAFKFGAFGNPWARFENGTLNPGFRSGETPGDLNVPFQRVSIASGSRQLDGFLVPAAAECEQHVAVLIFHGRNETVADWVAAQKHFREACITSLAFDYSGHGRSGGPGTIANLNDDAVAAYETFIKLTPGSRHCVFSHSMGGGPMLWAATSPVPTPDCVVIASPFSSLRSIAERYGMPKLLGALMPDVWDNVSQAKRIHAPLLWIHSRADRTNPIAEGQAVFDAAPNPKRALILDGYGHNAIYQELPEQIWTPMTAFIRG